MSKYFLVSNGKDTLIDDSYVMLGKIREEKFTDISAEKSIDITMSGNESFVVVSFDRTKTFSCDVLVSPTFLVGSTRHCVILIKNITGSLSIKANVYSYSGFLPQSSGIGLEIYNSSGDVVYSSKYLFAFNVLGKESGACNGNSNTYCNLISQDFSYMVYENHPIYVPAHPELQWVDGQYVTVNVPAYWKDNWENTFYRYGGSKDYGITDYCSSVSPSDEKTYVPTNTYSDLAIFVINSCIMPDAKGSTSRVYGSSFRVTGERIVTTKSLSFFDISRLDSDKTKSALSKEHKYTGYMGNTYKINYGYTNWDYDIYIMQMPS